MIGKIINAGAVPAGYVVKTRGVGESVYAEILKSVAELKAGEAFAVSQEELETRMAKALPKFFKANLRKKLVEKFGKGAAEMVELVSEGSKKSLFQIQKLA